MDSFSRSALLDFQKWWGLHVLKYLDSAQADRVISSFLKINFYWDIPALQHCVNFCCTVKRIGYRYIHVYLLFFGFPSHLCHHRALSRIPCIIQYVLISYLFYVCVSCSVVSESFLTMWTTAHQAPLSKEFSRQEYWSGLPFLSLGDLHDPGIEPRSPVLQADCLQSGKPLICFIHSINSVYESIPISQFFPLPTPFPLWYPYTVTFHLFYYSNFVLEYSWLTILW